MKNFNEIIKNKCLEKNNRLCIGLDLDNSKLISNSLDYMQKFIFDIIESTIDHCPVYKINFAFYEKHGSKGYAILEKIPEFINSRAITIADAKRGDIGNSSKYYADAILKNLGYDSITVSPYMGVDSIEPFMNYENKGVFILCLTSNKGSQDFQKLKIENIELYKKVALLVNKCNVKNNLGIVVGATNSDYLNQINEISPSIPWLMPGIGFQGGDLEESIKSEGNEGLSIINVSRGIIYHGSGSIEDIRKSSLEYTEKIRGLL